jgi:hypothetical protein
MSRSPLNFRLTRSGTAFALVLILVVGSLTPNFPAPHFDDLPLEPRATLTGWADPDAAIEIYLQRYIRALMRHRSSHAGPDKQTLSGERDGSCRFDASTYISSEVETAPASE